MRGTRLALTYLPGAEARPEVAFAIPRRLGNAVVRNRCRRRVRPLLDERAQTGRLRPGAYLVQVSGPLDALDPAALAAEVDALLTALDARVVS